MSDDSDDGDGAPKWVMIPLIAISVVAVVALLVVSARPPKGQVISVARAGEAGRQQLLVTLQFEHRGEDDTDYSYRLLFIDPATGTQVRSEDLPGRSEAGSAWGVAAGAGPYYWLVGRDGIVLRDTRNPDKSVTTRELAARHPEIVGPWHATLVEPIGTLSVESDDKRWWVLDPRTDQATPMVGVPYVGGDRFRDCYAPGWQRPGELLAFAELPTQRYSQKEAFALCRVSQISYAQPIDPKPVSEVRFYYPSFACDPDANAPITFEQPEGALFHASEVGRGRYWARIQPDASLTWRYDLPPVPPDGQDPGPGRAFRFDDQLVFVRGGRLFALGAADGKLRWERGL